MSKRIPPVLARLAVLCLCLAFATLNALAQSQATTGDIEGRVLDPNGAVVPNATVTARNQATGFERTANTDEDGNYRIILLPPGTYAVEATARLQQGGATAVQVTVGSQTVLDLNLWRKASTTVAITAEPPTVETTRTSVSTTINERAIQNLPINGRNFQDFATLSPGVIRDPRGGDLSVGGQRGTLNSLQVDGVDNNNTFFGQALGRGGVRPPYQFSEESVKEFQVNQNGFSAEFGRAGGAVINVVTKSGTNEFHGGLFEYLRDESLNANEPNTKANQFRAGRPNKRPASRSTSSASASAAPSSRTAPSSSSPTTASAQTSRTSSNRPISPRTRPPSRLYSRISHLSGRPQSGRVPPEDRHRPQPQQPTLPALQPSGLHGSTTSIPARSPPKSTPATVSSTATLSAAPSPPLSPSPSSTSFVSSCARHEPGTANSDLPEADQHRQRQPPLRPQQLQPARDDDQTRAVHQQSLLVAASTTTKSALI